MKTRIAVAICFVVVLALLLAFPPTGSGGTAPRGGNFVDADMVLVPAQTTVIGLCKEDLFDLVELGRDVPHMSEGKARWWFGDETPCHEVHVDSFLIDAHEVTNAQFCVFASVTGYEAEGPWRRHVSAARLDHPVVDVTWNDAVAYATWAGKRLPTEAEWEIAARGHSTARFFHWGDEPDPRCAQWRHQGDTLLGGLKRVLVGREIGTVDVGSMPANDLGLYEMLGNASEWVADDYAPYPGYEGPETPFREHGPAGGRDEATSKGKVVRGGCWESTNAVFVRLTMRSPAPPTHHSAQIGFRCARTVSEPTRPVIGR